MGIPAATSLLNLDEDVRLELDLPISEIKAMHDRISKMGEIRASVNCQRLPVKKVGRTLPLDMEAYEDDNMWLMSKKSKIDVSPDTPHEVDTVKSWLSRLPDGNAALAFDLASFATAETKSESSESTTSSFEVVRESALYSMNAEKVFRENINRIHAEPNSKWLLRSDEESSSTHLPRAPVPESFRADDEDDSDLSDEDDDVNAEWLVSPKSSLKPNPDCSSSSDSFKFINVINQLQNSNNSLWLASPKVDLRNDEDNSAAADHRRFLQKNLY